MHRRRHAPSLARTRHTTRSSSAAIAIAAIAIAAARPASAQPADDAAATAAAQVIYEQGLRAMEAGDLATACPKLAEVVRLEPRGAGARMQLARCYERQERLASAWATYLAAESSARTAGQRERAREAHDAADRLRPELSTLAVQVPAGADASFLVLRDGADLGVPQWNEPVPVDGGEHVIELRKAGETGSRHRATVVVAARRAKETVAIPAEALVDPVPAAAPSSPAVVAPAASTATPEPPTRDAAEPRGGVPTWTVVVGATGLALGGAAIALRAHAGSIESDQKERCGAQLDACPDDFDVEGTNDAKNTSFGLFVGMGVASIAALSVATIGIVAALGDEGAPTHGPTVAIGPGGFLVGGGAAW